jgi:sarcosine oxidase delta subunit
VYQNPYKYYGYLLEIPEEVWMSYIKCRKVVRSCKTYEQLQSAERYFNLWRNTVPKEYNSYTKRVERLLFKKMNKMETDHD